RALCARNILVATFRRSVVPGATYFFTVNTNQRLMLLTEPPFYLALKNALRQVNAEHPFTTEAFDLLPDHLHCIWTLPPGAANYALRSNNRQAGRRQGDRPLNRSRSQPCPPATPRIRAVATPVLGTPDPRRARLAQTRGVYSLEPGKAWLRRPGEGLAVFKFSPPCRTRALSAGLG